MARYTEELNNCFKTDFSVAQVVERWKNQLLDFKRHYANQAKSGNKRKGVRYDENFQDILSE